MAEPDQSAGDDQSPSRPPRLTLSQRLLTSLPDLQRDRSRRRPPSIEPSASGSIPDDDTETVEPDEVIAPSTARRSTSTRSSAPYRPQPKANPYADMSVEELRHSMKYLDDKERGVTMLAGPAIAALVAVVTIILFSHHNPAPGKPGHYTPSVQLTYAIVSVVLGLLVMVSGYIRRRSFALFLLLFAGLGGGPTTMIVSWIPAAWLFIHFNRMQKALYARTGGPGRNRQAQAATRAERLEQRRKALEERRRTGRRPAKMAPTNGPGQSKRYTPPRPAPPRPKP